MSVTQAREPSPRTIVNPVSAIQTKRVAGSTMMTAPSSEKNPRGTRNDASKATCAAAAMIASQAVRRAKPPVAKTCAAYAVRGERQCRRSSRHREQSERDVIEQPSARGIGRPIHENEERGEPAEQQRDEADKAHRETGSEEPLPAASEAHPYASAEGHPQGGRRATEHHPRQQCVAMGVNEARDLDRRRGRGGSAPDLGDDPGCGSQRHPHDAGTTCQATPRPCGALPGSAPQRNCHARLLQSLL